MRTVRCVGLLLFISALSGCGSGAAAPNDAGADAPEAGGPNVSVVQYHNSASRNGLYVDPVLTQGAVAGAALDTSFTATVTGNTYAQPLFLDSQGAGKDLVFIATEQNQVTAFDAADGSVVWQKTLGPAVDVATLVSSGQVESTCGTIKPSLGITGTGVVDPKARTLYLDAMIAVSTSPYVAKHFVYALSVDDGSTRDGWPFDVSTISSPFSFNSARAIQRGGLALVGGTIYVPFGSHADCLAPHGWVVAVPTANPSAATAWATASPAGGGGIWAPGGISTDGTSLFVSTSYFDSPSPPAQWTDADCLGVLRLGLTPSFSSATSDYWAPTDWVQMGDPASAAPVLFDLPGSTPSQLVLAFDRLSGDVTLLDQASFGGVGTGLVSKQVGAGENGGNDILTAPAVYTTSQGSYAVFNGASNDCGGDLTAIKITAGSPPSVANAWCANIHGHGLPIVSTSDGTNDPVVWAVGTEESDGTAGDNKLHAFDGDTGKVLFTSAAMSPTSRYITPIVAKGHVLVGGKNQLYSFIVPAQ